MRRADPSPACCGLPPGGFVWGLPRGKVGLVLLLTLLFAAPLLAAPTLTSASTWPVTPGETAWFRVSLLGRPGGYMYSTSRLVTEGPEELLEETTRIALTISLGGAPVKIAADTTTRYRRDLSPVEVRAHIDKLGVSVESLCRREGDMLRMTYQEGVQRREQTVPVPADYTGELSVLLAIARGELAAGEKRVVTIYDPQVGALDQVTITAPAPGQARTFTVAGQEVSAVPVTQHTRNLGADTILWLTPAGGVVRYEMPSLMNAVAEQVTEQEALAQLSPLVLSNEIPLGRQLPASATLTQVTFSAQSSTQDLATLIPATPRQQVQSQGRTGTLTIRAQRPPARTIPILLDPQGFEPHLESTPLAPLDAPRLHSLALEIAAKETDSWRAALALSRWVYGHLEKVKSQPAPVDALTILQQKRGDCSEHALLTAALCRARGIPARMITGLAAIGDKTYYHAWIEVYVGEWVEMDPTWNEDVVDAGHLRLADSDLDPVSFARMNLETGRCLGTLSLRVLDYATGEAPPA